MSEIIAFSSPERLLIHLCQTMLESSQPALAGLLSTKVQDLELLASIVGRSSSLTSDLGLSKEVRSLGTLAQKLINQGIEEVVNLPTKASLGRSFTVSKLHLFGFLLKIPSLQEHAPSLLARYHAILFSLMAEDLYISIIAESNGEEHWAEQATKELLYMWEERGSAQSDLFAPALQQLWEVRHSVVPVLGTLMGTVELLQLSFRLPPSWTEFLSLRGSDIQVVHALNEFLFSLSFEQLKSLQRVMNEKQLKSVSREDAKRLLNLRPSQLLEGGDEGELSAIRLYRSFLRRNDLARIRRDAGRSGPHRTLEQQLLLFLWAEGKA
ncbi:MAG: hypothetical protein VB127_00270 [Sphaerochaeta sp.]|jgi:hypothetical protein|nr:hypothetical protein [Sphaerochaeta sp.]